jgi:hypothetical protein
MSIPLKLYSTKRDNSKSSDKGPNMSEWRPIETAPKEGDFLAYIAYGYITRGRMIQGKWFAADSLGDGGRNKDTNPTHWMPLPEPPTAE